MLPGPAPPEGDSGCADALRESAAVEVEAEAEAPAELTSASAPEPDDPLPASPAAAEAEADAASDADGAATPAVLPAGGRAACGGDVVEAEEGDRASRAAAAAMAASVAAVLEGETMAFGGSTSGGTSRMSWEVADVCKRGTMIPRCSQIVRSPSTYLAQGASRQRRVRRADAAR